MQANTLKCRYLDSLPTKIESLLSNLHPNNTRMLLYKTSGCFNAQHPGVIIHNIRM